MLWLSPVALIPRAFSDWLLNTSTALVCVCEIHNAQNINVWKIATFLMFLVQAAVTCQSLSFEFSLQDILVSFIVKTCLKKTFKAGLMLLAFHRHLRGPLTYHHLPGYPMKPYCVWLRHRYITYSLLCRSQEEASCHEPVYLLKTKWQHRKRQEDRPCS